MRTETNTGVEPGIEIDNLLAKVFTTGRGEREGGRESTTCC